MHRQYANGGHRFTNHQRREDGREDGVPPQRAVRWPPTFFALRGASHVNVDGVGNPGTSTIGLATFVAASGVSTLSGAVTIDCDTSGCSMHCAVHHDALQRLVDVEMDGTDGRNVADNAIKTMGVDKGDDSDGLQRSTNPESAPSAPQDNETIIVNVSPADQSSSSSNNIRRSARQQHPPDRLVYPAAASSLGDKEATKPQGRNEDGTWYESGTRSVPP